MSARRRIRYTRVASQKAADGVFYITGGTHHSVAIEMQDHVIVVEAPLNDERALAVLAEVRPLIPNKPIRYVVVSHQHFDHSGGVRAVAGEGIALVAHEASKAFLERVITLPTTVSPDHLAKTGKKAMVEGCPRPARAQRRDADRRDPSRRGDPSRR